MAGQATSGDAGWDRVRHLHAGTHVHVAGDKQSKTCTLDLVDEATLRCSKGSSQYSFLRAEVKSVKLTRYGRSTLVGMVIGLGAGAGIGAIAGHTQEQPGRFFHGLTTEAYTADRRVGGSDCWCGDWRAYGLSARAYGLSAALDFSCGDVWRGRRAGA